MIKNIKYLNEKFNEFKNIGWIKSLRRGSGGIGYTFESMLGKQEDNFCFPDFKGIEIKTKHHNSNKAITLFHLTPDGEYLFPINYLRDKYGYPDKIIKTEKIFNISVSNLERSIFNNYLFKLKVDYKEKKVFLNIINLYTYSIDSKISWTLKSIEERLLIKLKYLAIVEANNKYINGIEYFHYFDIKFYKLINFNTFLKLIETGQINITFKIGIFHSGKRKGQLHDHGTSFCIDVKNISLLFKPILLFADH